MISDKSDLIKYSLVALGAAAGAYVIHNALKYAIIAPAAPAAAPAAPAAKAGNCSCMPMDSDPSRFKIETPDGVDCANHEYPPSMAACETLLKTVAGSPCCTGSGGGGGGGGKKAKSNYGSRYWD